MLVFVGLLVTVQSHSTFQSVQDDQGDILFLINFAKAYLCKGDNNWWKKISDPQLRLPMQFAVLTVCRPDFDIQEAVRELDKNAHAAMNHITRRKRIMVKECLWSATKQWLVISFFCPLQHPGIMETYSGNRNLLQGAGEKARSRILLHNYGNGTTKLRGNKEDSNAID